ncbi:MAG: flagellar hook assembly protein FlgD [Bdellovibrionales bacterium]|jgi:flagellar basal-body rod modification protein FlgD|nr:flagellar hook assembly protein FlgD [Bdellovibrionales bacterium]MBT3524664.1 flagellar hook assembly protein FlgD [Bdellovibrionales bacterium]MBT7767629.1 flagellar hook assembly protein FlgD [Bdellovibrionales bacterium]
MLLGGLSDAASAATGGTAATTSTQAQDKLKKDLNQFLNLLVTQLQNQDPLEPLDANEFTAQLVQFASVEQQIYQNSNLEKLVGMQQTSQVGSMVNYLGTTIEAEGGAFNLDNGAAKFSYNLEKGAVESTMTIQDAAGKTVWTTAASTDAGKQIYNWDGSKSDGTKAPDGAYKVTISAKDQAGNLINVAQTAFGRVTGAGANAGQVTLSMGAVDIAMEKILNVQETPKATTTTTTTTQ